MIASFLVNLVGALTFLFIFWKRLKEDYAGELIFRTAFLGTAGILVGFWISSKFIPSAFLWIEFVCGLLGVGIGIYRFNLRIFEVLEALVFGGLPWLALLFLESSVFSQSLTSFIGFVAVLLLASFAFYLDTHYKGFSWYKSGKVGFVGIMVLLVMFSVRLVTSFFKSDVLSFVKYEGLLSGLSAVICIFLIVYLSRDNK